MAGNKFCFYLGGGVFSCIKIGQTELSWNNKNLICLMTTIFMVKWSAVIMTMKTMMIDNDDADYADYDYYYYGG